MRTLSTTSVLASRLRLTVARVLALALLAAGPLAYASSAQSTANVTIPGEQTFILGEYADYAYRAKLTNEGRRLVTVTLRDKETDVAAESVALAPGEQAAFEVAASQEVTLENANARPAKVFVRMSRTVEGMRYVGLDGEDLDKSPAGAELTRGLPPIEVDADAGPAQAKATATLGRDQQFVVGEGTSASYAADLNNLGAAIEVSVRDRRTGEQTQGFGLGRAGKATVNVRPHEVLYLVHEGRGTTRVSVDFDREVSGARVEDL